MASTPCDSEDCAIYAVLGRELLGWGVTAPDVSQFKIFYRPGARPGDYVEQCPWAELGVAAPPSAGGPDEDKVQFFTQPQYGDDGASATVVYVTSRVMRDRRGRPHPPYIDQLNLTLKKADGQWTLVGRSQGPRT